MNISNQVRVEQERSALAIKELLESAGWISKLDDSGKFWVFKPPVGYPIVWWVPLERAICEQRILEDKELSTTKGG